jgi:hypothetical protein
MLRMGMTGVTAHSGPMEMLLLFQEIVVLRRLTQNRPFLGVNSWCGSGWCGQDVGGGGSRGGGSTRFLRGLNLLDLVDDIVIRRTVAVIAHQIDDFSFFFIVVRIIREDMLDNHGLLVRWTRFLRRRIEWWRRDVRWR